MADDEARAVHTVTLTFRTGDPRLAAELAALAFETAVRRAHLDPGLDWDVSRDRYTESRLMPVRLHDGDIDEIARRVRGEQPSDATDADIARAGCPPGAEIRRAEASR